MAKYVLEMSIVVKSDDRLDLEALQQMLTERIEALASGNKVEIVGQPILEVGDGEKDS